MSDFVLKLCPLCLLEITETDEVHVCEDCGIAHHQACREKQGVCGNANCPSNEKAAPQPARATFCGCCGMALNETQVFCPRCGTPVPGREIPVSDAPLPPAEAPAAEAPAAEPAAEPATESVAESVAGMVSEMMAEPAEPAAESAEPTAEPAAESAAEPAAEPVAEPAAPARRFCGNCGTELQPGQRFCGGCGQTV